MLESLRNAFSLPDLRRRILYTIGVLILYRLLANIPVPGATAAALSTLGQRTSGNALFETLNLLSGGAVSNFSVMAMGVYPYITASIIIQLLTPIIPYLDELSQEGESGRNRINKITYYLTVPLAVVQAIGQIQLIGLQYGTNGVAQVLPHFGFSSLANILPTLMTIMAMMGGTMFAIWLGERITEEGVGQGVSLIIFSGIVTGIPRGLRRIFSGVDQRGTPVTQTTQIVAVITFLVLLVGLTYVIVLIQEGHRRVPVQYGRRMRGRKVYQGQSTHIPLKVNTAGMIPIIFASSLLAFPSLLAQFFLPSADVLEPAWYNDMAQTVYNSFGQRQGWVYWVVYFLFVFGFTFFYTDVMVQQQRLHESLQKQGGFIPGIRPGKRTEQYIKSVIRRITFVGAFFLAIVAVIPGIMALLANLLNMPGLDLSAVVVNGSGLIIVVGVVIDTIRQLEAQLVMRNYEGFI
ncbi:MAG TPA: preprotein translocase subunit SecY [Gammaproteobacteria bacterium]|nr:preprotein translocase subunit SecY [Gammaproteobacteria bacterium]